jgi:hypothetical protein
MCQYLLIAMSRFGSDVKAPRQLKRELRKLSLAETSIFTRSAWTPRQALRFWTSSWDMTWQEEPEHACFAGEYYRFQLPLQHTD